ncbi:MAG: reverse transcriptase domain-containing protein, partial [Candidatus Thiodiazotropha sp.]
MRKYNINANLVRATKHLYDKAISAAQLNGNTGEWFRITAVVRQGCILSPTLFNIFLERIMSDALKEHDGKVSIGGRSIA